MAASAPRVLSKLAVKSAMTLMFSALESAGLTAATGSGTAGPAGTSAGLWPQLLLRADHRHRGAVGTPLTLRHASASLQHVTYLEEPVALHYHVGQALRCCQVLTQLPLVRLPQAALPLTRSAERGAHAEGCVSNCCAPRVHRAHPAGPPQGWKPAASAKTHRIDGPFHAV